MFTIALELQNTISSFFPFLCNKNSADCYVLLACRLSQEELDLKTQQKFSPLMPTSTPEKSYVCLALAIHG